MRSRLLKKTMAAFLSAAMAVTMLPLSAMSVKAEEKVVTQEGDGESKESSLLAYYTFDDENVKKEENSSDNKTFIRNHVKEGDDAYDAHVKREGYKLENGRLYLPGGPTPQKPPYMKIPGSIFDGHDSLTISIWVKNEGGSGDAAAMYFGTPTKDYGSGDTDAPDYYWLLNPNADPNGNLKSVCVKKHSKDKDSKDYETAVDDKFVPDKDWHLYTTVIEDKTISTYCDAKLIKKDDSMDMKISEYSAYGTLNAAIGRSGFPDPYFSGYFSDVKVYGKALSEAEILEDYNEKVDQFEKSKEKCLIAYYTFDDASVKKEENSSDNKTFIKNHVKEGDEAYDAHVKREGYTLKDGVLYLPGGPTPQKPPYMKIPGSIFSDQETMTISIWLKNDGGSSDAAAMYFGTPTKDYGSGEVDNPDYYWLLNPKADPKGNLKSVITKKHPIDKDSKDYESAVDENFLTDNEWHLYTTIIDKNSISTYYDGKLVKKDDSLDMTVKEMAAYGTINAAIGRSGFPDPYYSGYISDVKVYNRILTTDEILEDYNEKIIPLMKTGTEDVIKDLKKKMLGKNKKFEELTSDLTFPEELHNIKLTYKVTGTAVDKNGKVAEQTTEEQTADITVTGKFMDELMFKETVSVKVAAKPEEKPDKPDTPDTPGKEDPKPQPSPKPSVQPTAQITYGTEKTVDGSVYKVTDVNAATVAYTGLQDKSAAKAKIPATVTIDGKLFKVTSIADNAFKNGKKLKSVTIAANVTEIGKNAFAGCTSLKKIVIPKNVTVIGANAFSGDKSLKNVTIKAVKLKKVGKKAFKGIDKKAVIKVPKKQKAAYKKLLKKAVPATVVIK